VNHCIAPLAVTASSKIPFEHQPLLSNAALLTALLSKGQGLKIALTTEHKMVLVHTSWVVWVEFGFGFLSGIILQNQKEDKIHLFNIWLTFFGYFEQ